MSSGIAVYKVVEKFDLDGDVYEISRGWESGPGGYDKTATVEHKGKMRDGDPLASVYWLPEDLVLPEIREALVPGVNTEIKCGSHIGVDSTNPSIEVVTRTPKIARGTAPEVARSLGEEEILTVLRFGYGSPNPEKLLKVTLVSDNEVFVSEVIRDDRCGGNWIPEILSGEIFISGIFNDFEIGGEMHMNRTDKFWQSNIDPGTIIKFFYIPNRLNEIRLRVRGEYQTVPTEWVKIHHENREKWLNGG